MTLLCEQKALVGEDGIFYLYSASLIIKHIPKTLQASNE